MIIGIIIIILLIAWAMQSPITFCIGLMIVIGLCIWATKVENKKEEEDKQKKIIEDEKNKKIFNEKKTQYNIKEENLTINYKKGFAPIARTKQYVWLEKGNLCFFPAIAQDKEEKYILYKISFEDIEYFSTQGSISKQTKISGGGGEIGGSSIGGAVAGGIIAGSTGAIIGSRKKGEIESIKSEIVTHDDRETFINFFVNGNKHSMFFKYSDYTTLLKIIPEKDYNNFVNSCLSKGSKSSVTEQLKELAELKEKEIITEEEFNEKKKILLDKIK